MKSLRHAFLLIALLAADAGAEPFTWGINGHPASQAGYIEIPLAAQFDLLNELGVGWYRFDLNAAAFQGDTARMDAIVAEAEKRGVRLLPVLMTDRKSWDRKDSAHEIRAAARALASSVAGRYKGRITHWELDNELDGFAMIRKGETSPAGQLWKWDGAPDGSEPDHYQEIRYQSARAEIEGLYEGIKAADPSAVTIVDTAGWLHYGFIEHLLKEDHVSFDLLSWHWYSEMGEMTAVQGKLDLLDLLGRYGKPLWITEINRRDGSKAGAERAEADYLTGPVAKLAADRRVHGLFVYELLDEPYFGERGESHYGLVTLTRNAAGKWELGAKKPAFDALARRQHSKPEGR